MTLTLLAPGFVSLLLGAVPMDPTAPPAIRPAVQTEAVGGAIAFRVRGQGCVYTGTAARVAVGNNGTRLLLEGTKDNLAVLSVELVGQERWRTKYAGRSINLELTTGNIQCVGVAP